MAHWGCAFALLCLLSSHFLASSVDDEDDDLTTDPLVEWLAAWLASPIAY
jgi:hypothetical protein